MSSEIVVSVGQQYKSKDRRRVSVLTITDVSNAYGDGADTVRATSLDPVTQRKTRVIVRVARLRTKYNLLS